MEERVRAIAGRLRQILAVRLSSGASPIERDKGTHAIRPARDRLKGEAVVSGAFDNCR
jgi:hypothetical protein